MRTKIAVLSAAALAVGLAAASAQVYSQNIVGYVNVTTQPVANRYWLVANPLDNGQTNTILSLFGTVSNQTSIETWNGTSFNLYNKLAGSWGAGTNVVLAPGTGFFIKYPASMGVVTNTFVGNVVIQSPNGVDSGGTNTMSLPTNYVCVGSILPISGGVLDNGDGNLNLGAVLANQSSIETWNGTSFDLYNRLAGSWGLGTNVVLNIGQGFFVKSKNATNWSQVLP